MLSTKTGASLVSGLASHSNGGPTMLIDVIRGFVFEGKDIKPGDTVEVSDKFARQMIHRGKAEAAPEPNKLKRKKKK